MKNSTKSLKSLSNPRYVAYAKAHNKTPAKMLEHDKKKWKGGCMCGFILWIDQKKQEFFKAHPEAFFDRYRISDQNKWTNFLNSTEKK